MTGISALPASIVEWLSSQEYLEDIKFLTEYPPQYKAVPLKKPIVSVGVNNITITDHFTLNDNDVLERDEYCRTANIEIILSIHVPFSDGGEKCHEVFTSVVDYLTFSSDLNIVQSHCDHIVSDRDTDALVMNAYINIESDFCPSEEIDDAFHSFLDKELLCGSHIRDTDIHITAAEREKWNTSAVSGFYTGTGAAERSLDIGFRPLFLGVVCTGHVVAEYSSSLPKARIYSALACGNYTSRGVQTTNDGFKVLNNSSASNDYGELKLNEMGQTYCYFAIKPN